MMLEMLKTNQIAANSRNVFSMIYQSDAVEFAYRVMMAEHPKYPLYHISSGEVISQMKLAELIQQNAGDGTTIRDDTWCWMADGTGKNLTEKFLSHTKKA